MNLIRLVYYGLLGICLVTLMLNAKKLTKIYYWFIPIIILGIITQAWQEMLKQKNITGYDFVFHIYQPLEYSLLALFYYHLIHSRVVKKMILLSIPLMLLFSIFYYTIGSGVFYGGDFIDFCVCAFFICIWVVIFFLELLRSEEKLELANYPAFWINAANLLFYGGNLMIMGIYYSVLESDPEIAKQLLKVNHGLNLVLYIMYIIGFIQPIQWKK